MKRLAILMGSPTTQEPKLTGVYTDIERMHSFLKSSKGGGWYDNEIITTTFDPSVEEVNNALSKLKDVGFGIVYFSGHGALVNGREQIRLSKTETLKVDSLLCKSKRQITIIDACRSSPVDGGLSGFDGEDYFDGGNTARSREIFSKAINASAEAQILIFASERGKNTGDGYFTPNLLTATSRLVSSNSEGIISIQEVFDATYKLSTKGKKPELINHTNNGRTLPFVVKDTSSVSIHEDSGNKASTKKSDFVNILLLGAGGALLLALLIYIVYIITKDENKE